MLNCNYYKLYRGFLGGAYESVEEICVCAVRGRGFRGAGCPGIRRRRAVEAKRPRLVV